MTVQSYMDKRQALTNLQRDLRQAFPCRALVFGEGPPDASVAMVGEAPGREEEAQGRPFVGRAGKMLDPLLAEAGLDRDNIWITNMVKWRPRSDGGTRSPRADEIDKSKDWLLKELNILWPRLVVCLGSVAASALIDADFRLASDHGGWMAGPFGIPTLGTFHPSYAARFRGDALAALRKDLGMVKQRLDALEILPKRA